MLAVAGPRHVAWRSSAGEIDAGALGGSLQPPNGATTNAIIAPAARLQGVRGCAVPSGDMGAFYHEPELVGTAHLLCRARAALDQPSTSCAAGVSDEAAKKKRRRVPPPVVE